MPTYKITALKPVEITAYVWYSGSRPMPSDHQGNTLPPMAAILNHSEDFELGTGETRNDIAFLEKVQGSFFQSTLPETLNGESIYKDLLKIVKISDDKPSL